MVILFGMILFFKYGQKNLLRKVKAQGHEI